MVENGLETLAARPVNGEHAETGEYVERSQEVVTVLAKDDTLSGRLQIRGSGVIQGTFSGRIECDGDIMVGPEAHVEADIRGARVTIAGYVRGNVLASSRLKLTNTARLEGDARVGALVVQEGGVHHGVIRVHPEGVPEGTEQVVAGPAHASPSRATPAAKGGIEALSSPVGRVRKLWGEFF
jgi:cytoskeletal protein CcmA (bactofilin family)